MFSYVEGPYPYYIVLWYGLWFGVFAGLLYECFRILRCAQRQMLKGSGRFLEFLNILLVFFQDILYFLLLSVAAVLFIYVCNRGQLRISILVCMALGFVFYIKTVGRLIFTLHMRLLSLIAFAFRLVFRYTLRYLFLFFIWVYRSSIGKAVMCFRNTRKRIWEQYAYRSGMRKLEKLIKVSKEPLKEGKDFVSLH